MLLTFLKLAHASKVYSAQFLYNYSKRLGISLLIIVIKEPGLLYNISFVLTC
jgi:hypothetical protein